MAAPGPKSIAAGREISRHLDEIRKLYKDEVAFTLVIRNLDALDGSRDMLVSDEADIEAAIHALERLRGNPRAHDVKMTQNGEVP
jgi:hypothetical protein